MITGYRNKPTVSSTTIAAPVPVGIRAYNTNLFVRNTKFTNIGKFLPATEEIVGRGIDGLNNSGTVKTLDFVGLGRDGEASFNNVHTGMDCLGMSIFVSETKFVKGKNHVDIYDAKFPAQYVFHRNRFEAYACQGIFAHRLFPVQKFEVTSNYFVDNLLASYAAGLGVVGLRVVNPVTTLGGQPVPTYTSIPKAGSLFVSDNHFINENKTPDVSTSYQHEGANIAGIYDATLSGNFFENEFTGGILSTGSYIGSKLYACPSYSLIDNSFTGTTQSYAASAGNPTGAVIEHSGYGANQCNGFNLLETGMSFDGYFCEGTFLFQNDFGQHHSGLILSANTMIGEQDGTQNSWEFATTTPNVEALFPVPSTDPDFLTKMAASKFQIYESENTTPQRWAIPRVPSGSAWFSESFTEPLTYSVACDVDQYPPDPRKNITYTDRNVIYGTMPELDGYPATKWDASMRLYTKLFTYPDLHPYGSAADEFYSAKGSSTFARLGTVSEQLRTITRPSNTLYETLDDYYEQLRSNGLRLVLIDSLISIASGGQLSALLVERDSLNDVQVATEQSLASALSTYSASRNTVLQALMTDLTGIDATEQYELNMQTVLRTMIEDAVATTGQSWTTQQQADLEDVAEQCSLSGGYRVILARAMLFDQQFEDDSSSEERSSAQSKTLASFEAYPNPTTGSLRLQLFKPMGEGSAVAVKDPTGRQVLHQSMSAGIKTTDLNLSGLTPGLYFVHLLDGSNSVSVKRVFLNQ